MKLLTDNIRALIAYSTHFLTFVYFFLAAFFFDVKDAQITIAVIAVNLMVFQYFYGSSQGSANKQQTIDNSINKTN